jgi:AhpC/TSA family
MLVVGKRFPDFALPNQDGRTMRLKDFAGKWLVLYIYPKDDTPGCTHLGHESGPRVRIPSAPATSQCEPPVRFCLVDFNNIENLVLAETKDKKP